MADLQWSPDKKQLSLIAACTLPAGTVLSPAILAVDAEPPHVLHTHGAPALAWAQQQQAMQQAHPTSPTLPQQYPGPVTQSAAQQQQFGVQSAAQQIQPEADTLPRPHGSVAQSAAQQQRVAESSSLAWQAWTAGSYELCLEPAEEDEARAYKLMLLQASALGISHHLTMSSSQVSPLLVGLHPQWGVQRFGCMLCIEWSACKAASLERCALDCF